MAIAKFYRCHSRNVAGNQYLFLANAENIDTITVTSGEVSSVSMVGANKFMQVKADPYSINRKQTGQRSNKSHTYYQHDLDFKCSYADVTLNDLIDDIDDAQPCGLVAIVMDGNGKCWLVGYNEDDEGKRPIYLEQNEFVSGEKPDDNGGNHAFTLSGANSGKDLPLSSDLTSYIQEQIDDDMGVGSGAELGFYGPELHVAANAASDPNSNEADATTGWTEAGLNGTGANVFESQSAVKNVGSYAMHTDANDTPTVAARAQLNTAVENGATYRISIDIRHIGTGGQWVIDVEGVIVATILNTNVTFQTITHDVTMADTDLRIQITEGSGSNDGGVYFDNVSIRKKL